MTRKILTLLLALALLLSLAACGGDKTPEPETSSVPKDDVTMPTPTPTAPPVPDKGTPPVWDSPAPTETPAPTPDSTAPIGDPPAPSATPEPEATTVPAPEPEAVTCAAIWESIQSQMGGNMPAFMSGTADDLLSLYGIDSSAVEEFSLNMPMMMVHATEIFIARATPGNMDAVKAGIALRKQNLLDQWSTYLPAQYDLVEKAQVVTSGDYVLFVIAEEADTIAGIFTAATAG